MSFGGGGGGYAKGILGARVGSLGWLLGYVV